MLIELVIAIIGIVVAIVSAIYGIRGYKLAREVDKRVPEYLKQYLIITARVPESHPFKTIVTVHNMGDFTAHDFSLWIRFPPKSEIKSVEKGLFEVVEGGEGSHFVKFWRDQVPPRTGLPSISIEAEKRGESVPPEAMFAESKEVPKFPIRWARGTEEIL